MSKQTLKNRQTDEQKLRITLIYSNITAFIMSIIKDYLQAAQAGQQHLVYLVDQYPPRKQPKLQYDYKCIKM